MAGVRLLIALLLTLLSVDIAAGQVAYGEDGLEVRTPDGGFSALIGWRNQIRFTTPFVSPPEDAGDFERGRRNDFRLNRSRLKAEGHLFTTRLTYTFQADFEEERVRDLNVAYAVRDWLQVRAGWWKIEHLLERRQSSGAQQMVDRSILDRWFAFGRQGGVQVHGRVGGKSGWGGHYYVGAFRNVDVDARGGETLPVWLGRYEWSWAGREPEDLEQGDPDASRELRLTVGASAVRTEGAYAFYSGSGLGTSLPLPGLPGDDDLLETPDRYRTRHYGTDAALKWRGLSVQGELHRKDVEATGTGDRRTLLGGYLMGGVLAATLWPRAPRALELSTRVALVDPSRADDDDLQQERTVGANWYLRGHRSKISLDLTRLHYDTAEGTRTTDVRTRLQWEFTF